MAHRPERLAESIKKEVSDMIINELKDPRIGFTSITSVEVSRDLSFAKIFVSVLGTEEEQKATVEALSRANGFIRAEIGRRIRLRHVPELAFISDQSIAHGTKIMKLLQDVQVQGEGMHE
ncbi:ribosome-binding factor A [Desulfofarcimen acetoxidans DSM 771]|jgi:ribosome-binding factor A|uniref:Ribosome-binding factor A n=1 Tax=Desulfofarcimen acetoxidans (strain ATCC 49208 / DSM 771 / KCTC 5769 / VKM B-1644 / 5575) TaxID=485916 RepID=C8W4P3_DESAS|nr:30S ribosome-binding factor RbfA [Desulfofarcimen acetoxidans]ACV63929.1 ribosome-binding factor A [Desulfofarcimen acetoxidans DSM 771]